MTLASADKFPGYHELLNAYMSSEFSPADVRDIAPLIPSFQIIESMKNDSIHGSAVVHDSIGLLEEFPIRGEEVLTLVLKDVLDNEVTYNMRIYKVDNVKYNNDNSTVIYTIHFVSLQRYRASLRRLIKSYEKPASEIIKDIFGEFLRREARPSDYMSLPNMTVMDKGSDEFKNLIVEDTQDIIKCIIPNYTPMQACRFISNRSMSPKYKSCSFRFFERLDSFYFATDEYMMEKAIKEDKIFKFTSTSIPRAGEFFKAEMDNFQSISNVDKINTINDLLSGAYKSQAIVLDILYGIANIKQNKKIYDYNPNDYYNFPKPYDEITDKHTQKFIDNTMTEENCKKFIIIKDYDDKNGGVLPGNKHYPDIILHRNAYMTHIENVTVSAVGHGRLDITCGDVINLALPNVNSTDNKGGGNKHLRGNYLVHGITRVFDKEVAKCIYTLVKKDWADAEDE